MKEKWRMDRRVPVAVMIMLLMQVGGVLVWATQLDARVSGIERQAITTGMLNEKFTRLDERLDNMKQDLSEVRQQLGRLTERLLKR